MRKIGRIILQVAFIVSSIVPMLLGFITGFVKRTFRAGMVNAENFINWV